MSTIDPQAAPRKPTVRPAPYDPSAKQKSADKTSRLPVKIVQTERLKKPEWIRVKAAAPGSRFHDIKRILRENNMFTVCEEASCPNIGECFGKGTATFMIMGDKCARCPFCTSVTVAPTETRTGRQSGAQHWRMRLSYVVITSVDRDDLRDSGAAHSPCIREYVPIARYPHRGAGARFPRASAAGARHLHVEPPDVMNHNLETVPRLYKQAAGGRHHSLKLLGGRCALGAHKSGLMVGWASRRRNHGVMRDMREHDIEMLWAYLQPSVHHLPVTRYVHPDTFKMFEEAAYDMG